MTRIPRVLGYPITKSSMVGSHLLISQDLGTKRINSQWACLSMLSSQTEASQKCVGFSWVKAPGCDYFSYSHNKYNMPVKI